MRVLVTGHNGFTGVHLAGTLVSRGHAVVGLAADLRDRDAVARAVDEAAPDAVVHLAAQSFVAHGNVAETYETNLLGTLNLLDALRGRAARLSVVLLASSASVYGNGREGALSEDTPPAPANHYGVSKLAMEQAAALYTVDLPVSVVRPFNYTGVGQKETFLVPKIVAHARRHAAEIELGNLDVLREFGDVRRVASIYARLLERPVTGSALNVCTGEGYAIRDLLDICAEITGHRMEAKVNPALVRSNEVRRMVGDPTRLAMNCDLPPPVALRDTLTWMLTA